MLSHAINVLLNEKTELAVTKVWSGGKRTTTQTMRVRVLETKNSYGQVDGHRIKVTCDEVGPTIELLNDWRGNYLPLEELKKLSGWDGFPIGFNSKEWALITAREYQEQFLKGEFSHLWDGENSGYFKAVEDANR